MRKGLMGTLAASLLAILIGVAPVAAESPHFVPSAFTGIVQPNGDLELGYMAAGLGPNKSGYIRAKGWFKMGCTGPGGAKQWTRRAVERTIFADEYGNVKKSELLNINPCDNPGGNWGSATASWACVSLSLYIDQYSTAPVEVKYFEDILTGGNVSPKCDKLK